METTWFSEDLSVLPFLLIKLRFHPIMHQLKPNYSQLEVLLDIRLTQKQHKPYKPVETT